MLSHFRKLPQAHVSLSSGKWDRHAFAGRELAGKTLALLGMGRIGVAVAARARAFSMQCIAFDPFLSEERAEKLNVEKVELEELFKRADVLSLHAPLTDETHEIINEANLNLMKPGALLVNCARGGLVNESDLAAALDKRKISGAALDVFSSEPPHSSPLCGHELVLHTPHLGASTLEAKENVSLDLAKSLEKILLHDDYSPAMNQPHTGAMSPAQHCLLDLAKRMGRFQGGLLQSAAVKFELEVPSDLNMDSKSLSVSFLCGLLQSVSGEAINIVNVMGKAQHMGIVISLATRPAEEGMPQLLVSRVEQEDEVHEVSGAMLALNTPRILQVDGHWLDVQPWGKNLVLWNEDAPGVLGRIGSFLGDAGINIAELRLGRSAASSTAVSVWQLDQNVSCQLQQELRSLPSIFKVFQLQLGPAPSKGLRQL